MLGEDPAFGLQPATVLPNGVSGSCASRHRWRFEAAQIEPDKNVRLLLPL